MRICQGKELSFDCLNRLRLENFRPQEFEKIWDKDYFVKKEEDYIKEFLKRRALDSADKSRIERELLRKELIHIFTLDSEKVNQKRLEFLENGYFKEIYERYKLNEIYKPWLIFWLLVPLYILSIVGACFLENILEGLEGGFLKILINGFIYSFLALFACWIIGFSLSNLEYIKFLNTYYQEIYLNSSDFSELTKIRYDELIYKTGYRFGLFMLFFIYLSIGIIDIRDLLSLRKLFFDLLELGVVSGFSYYLVKLIKQGHFRAYLRDFILFENQEALIEYASFSYHNHNIDSYIERYYDQNKKQM